MEEFDSKAREFEQEQTLSTNGQFLLTNGTQVLSCVHKDHEGVAHFAHGMCRACYIDYARVSGGAQGGQDPPAFQEAEEKREREAKALLLASESHDNENELKNNYEKALTNDFDKALTIITEENAVAQQGTGHHSSAESEHRAEPSTRYDDPF